MILPLIFRYKDCLNHKITVWKFRNEESMFLLTILPY